MVYNDQYILTKLTTIQERVEVRYAAYARQYEAFRRLPVCEDETDRELQLSIAYLYHTSLSILEERSTGMKDYLEDVRDVLLSLGDMHDADKVVEIRTNVSEECQQEVRDLEHELRDIDRGVSMAHRHQAELMTD